MLTLSLFKTDHQSLNRILRLAFLISIFIIPYSVIATAQSYQVSGTLITQDVNLDPTSASTIKEPLVGVEVKLYKEDVLLATTNTNDEGFFTLTHSAQSGRLRIVVEPTEALQGVVIGDEPNLSKKGFGIGINDNNNWEAKVEEVDGSWHYTWGNQIPDSYPHDIVEYVPMTWSAYGDFSGLDAIVDRVNDWAAEGKVHYLLGFNEPDAASQANLTVQQAIDAWPRLMNANVSLVSPAPVHATGQWLQDFMDGANARDYRVDYIGVHWYKGPNVNQFINDMQAVYDLYGLPIWITEFGVADWGVTSTDENRYSEQQVIDFMSQVLPLLDDLDFVKRYAWFNSDPNHPPLTTSALFDENGEITDLGIIYKNHDASSYINGGSNHEIGSNTVPYKKGSVTFHGVDYRTVTIGNQVWMAENLRTNKYRNGDAIPYVTDNSDWSNLTSGAWAIHANPAQGEDHVKNFNRGKLYNWHAINDNRGLCPVGWEVPTDDDFKVLEAQLGMLEADLDLMGGDWRGAAQEVSNKLRSTGGADDFFWREDNTTEPIATNSTGFSMRGTSLRFAGGGFGTGDGDFSGLGEIAQIWTSTENNANTAIRRIIRSNQAGVRRNTVAKESGLAVRCIKADETTSLVFSDTDGPGWRMMSIPFYGKTASDLAAQNQVTGIPGANNFYGGNGLESSNMANLYKFDPELYDSQSQVSTGWTIPENFNSEFDIGTGFIWYFYNNDDYQSNSLNGFNLSLTGISPLNDVTVPITAGSWNLVGNPFNSNLSASQLSSDGLTSASAQVWNSKDGGYWEIIEFTGTNTISSWQGFLIESNDASIFTIPESARTTDQATFYSVEDDIRIAFSLFGEDDKTGVSSMDKAVALVLDDQTSDSWDSRDIRKLKSMNDHFASLSFIGMRGEESLLKAQESRPLNFDETLELPLILNTKDFTGSLTLEWDGINSIPNELSIILTDHLTNSSVNLRTADTYSFVSTEANTINQHRFTLVLSYLVTSNPVELELPQQLQLSQNYPNPFNPTTQINFEIPLDTHVRLSVYDMLGRRVSVLVDESKNPGSYHVTWDASRLSSGVYLYKIEAGGQVMTRHMTLIK